MARAIFKAIIRFDRIRVPIKLYAAVDDPRTHFRLLHATDRTPVRQHMVEPDSGKVVPPEAQRRGYPLGDGRYVIIEDDDLSALEPEPSRDITIERFVERAAIDPIWYERPYFLGPDGGAEPYFALAQALAKDDLVGIGHWVMRKRAYVGALLCHGKGLALVRLHHAGEVLDSSELPRPSGRAPEKQELALANQLIGALEAPFDPSEYQNETEERMRKMLAAKARGKKLPKPKAPRRRAPPSLAAALKKSVRAAQAKAA